MRQGPHPALNCFSLALSSLWWRTSTCVQSWMGKHKIPSNVSQLSTVKEKKKKINKKMEEYTSAEENGSKMKGEEALFWFKFKLGLLLQVVTKEFLKAHSAVFMCLASGNMIFAIFLNYLLTRRQRQISNAFIRSDEQVVSFYKCLHLPSCPISLIRVKKKETPIHFNWDRANSSNRH